MVDQVTIKIYLLSGTLHSWVNNNKNPKKHNTMIINVKK